MLILRRIRGHVQKRLDSTFSLMRSIQHHTANHRRYLSGFHGSIIAPPTPIAAALWLWEALQSSSAFSRTAVEGHRIAQSLLRLPPRLTCSSFE